MDYKGELKRYIKNKGYKYSKNVIKYGKNMVKRVENTETLSEFFLYNNIGIYLYESDGCEISDNILEINEIYGAYLHKSNSNIFNNNTIIRGGVGIGLMSGCDRNIITIQNRITDSDTCDLYFENSNDCANTTYSGGLVCEYLPCSSCPPGKCVSFGM